MRSVSLAIAVAFVVGLTVAGLAVAGGLDGAVGKALFDRIWVPAPATTNAADGLGPLFNARSCATCHRGGGPARVTTDDDGVQHVVGAVVRLGDAAGKTDPYYGLQLQTLAVAGLPAEGSVSFLPSLSFTLAGPPLAEGIRSSARIAPSLAGRGRFEDITDASILAGEDPDDRDGDGISGRAHRVPVGLPEASIGRFGWKAAHATLEAQVAHALAIDLGLSSPQNAHAYGDCTTQQTACRSAPNGQSQAFDGREVSAAMVAMMARYIKGITTNPQSAAPGREIFDAAQCGSCHRPEMPGRDGKPIATFTDLLLHDMGSGLNDGVGEPGVEPQEWRTPPLTALSSRDGVRRYLHDGRATTVDDAIRQHGGEAKSSMRAYQDLDDKQQRLLREYLQGL